MCIFCTRYNHRRRWARGKLNFKIFSPHTSVDSLMFFSSSHRRREAEKPSRQKEIGEGRKRQAAQIGSKSNLTERGCVGWGRKLWISQFPIVHNSTAQADTQENASSYESFQSSFLFFAAVHNTQLFFCQHQNTTLWASNAIQHTLCELQWDVQSSCNEIFAARHSPFAVCALAKVGIWETQCEALTPLHVDISR